MSGDKKVFFSSFSTWGIRFVHSFSEKGHWLVFKVRWSFEAWGCCGRRNKSSNEVQILPEVTLTPTQPPFRGRYFRWARVRG
jgi:hypothetical protein